MHWWKELGGGAFGLTHDVHVLRRTKFNHERCDFYPAHHILEDVFDTMILHALRCVVREDNTFPIVH